MKALIFALITVGSIASAQEVALPEGSVSAQPIAGELKDVTYTSPRCPRGMECVPAGLATYEFVLNGCMNTIGPVTVKVVRSDDVVDVFISATEIVNSRSQTVRCKRAPVVTAQVGLGPQYVIKSMVRTHFLTDMTDAVQR